MQKKIIIIGGGPAGYEAALHGASLGGDITLIEKHKIGGTCLNYGCIPTKTLIEHADFYHKTKHPGHLGVQVKSVELDYNQLIEHKRSVIDTLSSGILTRLKKAKVNYIEGTGTILKPGTVEITDVNGHVQVLEGDSIVLATGSKPLIPGFQGVNSERVLTSKSLLSLNTLPKSITIVGGGVIGMEFAVLLQNFGVQVTVLEYASNILPNLDSGLGKRLKSMVAKQGVQIITKAEVTRFEECSDTVKVFYKGKKGEQSVQSEVSLMAIGRIGNFSGKMLDALKIKYNERFIEVNEHYRTSIETIYAIGDVNGISLLAHSAYDQGRQLMDHLLKDKPIIKKPVPGCVFTSPEVSSIGISEDEAKASGMNYSVQKTMFGASGKALAMGEGQGFIKTVINDERLIIGCHILGPHSSDLIHYAAIAMTSNMTVDWLSEIIFAHPTLGELFGDNARQF